MALTYNEITAIAQNAIEKTLTDNVFKSTPFLARLRAKQKKVAGGVKIQEPIIGSKTTSGGWYEDVDALTITKQDNMTAAVFDWRQLYESVRISRLDLAKTSGDAGKLDLVASKIKIAEASIAENLSAGIFSAGGSKKIDGLGAIMSDSTTYAGIAPADLVTWKANVLGNSAVDRDLTLALLQKLDGACTDGKYAPTLFLAQQAVYDVAYNLYTPFQRIESEEIAKLGFKSIMVNGKPMIVDANMAAKAVYAVNEEFLKLVVNSDNDMRKEHHASLETTDSMLTKIFWMGNIVCPKRSAHGALLDIDVA